MIHKYTTTRKKNNLAVRLLKAICLLPFFLVLLLISTSAVGRGISWFGHYIDTSEGVNEGIYLPVCGQEQYLLLRGRDTDNPIILYLHGGPGGPDAPITNLFSDYLIDDYTVVCWDQRGCGRTYYKNKDTDPENNTATFEQALCDTDAIVDYLRDRLGTDKVIIIGHSYGSLLGSRYVREHSEKVQAFVGIGQFVNIRRSDELAYKDALEVASSRGEDTSALEEAYHKYLNADNMEDFLNLRRMTEPYHPPEVETHTIKKAFFSPYTGIDDARWALRQTSDPEGYSKLNKQLYDYVYTYNIYDDPMEYPVPAFFISGDRDYICNYTLAEKYCEDITAPVKEFAAIPGCGHVPQFSEPEVFAEILKEMLDKIR